MPAPPADGPIRHGHYTVRQRADGGPVVLGAGAMGVTYKAWDERLQIDVALKVIAPARLADPEAQALFLREARAAARVRHPNVASVLFLGDTPGHYFYAMEFIEGQPLDLWLAKHGPLQLRESLGLARQIASGLGAIHDAHLVHRDLKPSNVMVVAGRSTKGSSSGPTWELRIIDFGLARSTQAQADDAVQTIGFRGTLRYASPEQCVERRDLDGRADLYALGCILWELLTGFPPFMASNQRDLLNQHVSNAPPQNRLSHCPPSVRRLVNALLAKDRDHRPAHAQEAAAELAAALAEIEGDGQGATRPPERPPPSTSPGRGAGARPRWILPTVGAAVVLLSLGLGAWLRYQDQTAVARPAVAPAAEHSKKDVAVLPFEVLSSDKADAGLADGIHEDVIVNLVKARDLRVIARSSVQFFRGPQRDLRQIAEALRAGSIVEGTVRRVGNRVRVSASLVDAQSARSIWAENFEADAGDLFDLQAALARKIALSLEAHLTPAEDRAIQQRPTQNMRAWAAYQKARELQRSALTITRENFEAVIAALEEAVAEDPKFALAYAQLAGVHGELFWFRFDRAPSRRAAAEKAAYMARALAPDLPESHLAVGNLLYRIDLDFPGAYQEFKTAETLRPHDPEVLFHVGLVSRRLGLADEGERALSAACDLSPADAKYVNALAIFLNLRRKSVAAVRRMERLLKYYPQDPAIREFTARCRLYGDLDWLKYRAVFFPLAPSLDNTELVVWAHLMDRNPQAVLDLLQPVLGRPIPGTLDRLPASFYAGYAHRMRGESELAEARLREAAAELEAARSSDAKSAYQTANLAQTQALLGQKELALQTAELAMQEFPITADALDGGDIVLRAVMVYAWVGEEERALQLLASLLTRPSSAHRVELQLHPMWDTLRANPRFEAMLAEMQGPIGQRR